jgi:uncharacterized membrane protein YeaQ/YmgE (transglycosylase-associated protein family)
MFWSSLNVGNKGTANMLWQIITIIIVGFVVGIIAKLITPGDKGYEPQGFVLTAALGVAGALVATLIGQWIGHYGPNEAAGWIASIVGAVVILLIWGWFQRRQT